MRIESDRFAPVRVDPPVLEGLVSIDEEVPDRRLLAEAEAEVDTALKCHSCGAPAGRDDETCAACGVEWPIARPRCNRCGLLSRGGGICHNCGERL